MIYNFLAIHVIISMGLLFLSMVTIPSVTKDVPDLTFGQRLTVFIVLITPVANIILAWYVTKVMLGFGKR